MLAVIETADHLPEPVAIGRGDAAEVISLTLIPAYLRLTETIGCLSFRS